MIQMSNYVTLHQIYFPTTSTICLPQTKRNQYVEQFNFLF
jgi:hypothetical protein